MPLVLHAADLFDELVCKHIDELVKLVLDSQEHVSDVLLPVGYCVWHPLVLSDDPFSHLLDLLEFLQVVLIAFVYEVHFAFDDQTLDTRVGLFFFLPKIERQPMLAALDGALCVIWMDIARLLPCYFADECV